MHTLLIIEDDATLLRGLKDNFEDAGYHVHTAEDGEKGLEVATSLLPDLIVLDIMLPKINGYEICRNLREDGLDMPIVMLTAKGQESDIVLGLKLGADDYVTKPFGIRELLARVEAFLRRRSRPEEHLFTFGECTLDPRSHRFTRNGKEESLSPKEFELLQFLCEHEGRVLDRDRILRSVWGTDMVTPRSIDRFVNALRARIETDPHRPVFIQTVREFGYRFCSTV